MCKCTFTVIGISNDNPTPSGGSPCVGDPWATESATPFHVLGSGILNMTIFGLVALTAGMSAPSMSPTVFAWSWFFLVLLGSAGWSRRTRLVELGGQVRNLFN